MAVAAWTATCVHHLAAAWLAVRPRQRLPGPERSAASISCAPSHACNRSQYVALPPRLAYSDDLSVEALRCLWSVLRSGEVSWQIDEAARRVLCQQHAEQLQAMARKAQQRQQGQDQLQQTDN